MDENLDLLKEIDQNIDLWKIKAENYSNKGFINQFFSLNDQVLIE